jgi:RHS repeat-associated protein
MHRKSNQLAQTEDEQTRIEVRLDSPVSRWTLTVQYIDRAGATTAYTYDYHGRKIKEVLGSGTGDAVTNQFIYNAAGDLVALIDGLGHVTQWGYDAWGRVTSKTNAANTEVVRYKYDANGRMTNRWTVGKGNTSYQYDPAGNLTRSASANATNQLAYAALNRVTNLVDAVGTSRYGYSSGGMLISEDGPWDQDMVQTTVANRLRTQLTLPLPNAAAFLQTYACDTAKRLTNTTSTAGSFGYSYTRTGQGSELGLLVNGLRLPSGAFVTNTFDALGRMTGTWLKNSGGTALNSHRYTYTNMYRISVTNFFTNYVNYGYDSLGQVKSASGYEPGGGLRAQEVLSYGYDRAGNLHYRTNNELAQTFTADTVNQLSTVTRNSTMTVAGATTMPATQVSVSANGGSAATATRYADNTYAKTGVSLVDGTNTFTAVAQDNKGRYDTNSITLYLPASQNFAYDANGNLTSDGRRGFEYDDENQLTQVTVTNAWRTAYHYDGQRRLRIAKDYSWNGVTWIKTNEVRYVYDGMLVIQERDANNLPIKTYTRGLDVSGSLQGAGGIGCLLAMTDHKDISTRHYYYHSDANGNVTALINEQQVVMARYAYDPFGNQIMAVGPVSALNPYRFSSKEWHPISGLYYYGYRFYEPNFQRWINQDPVEEEGGINLHEAFGNNSTHRADIYRLVSVTIDGPIANHTYPTINNGDCSGTYFRAPRFLVFPVPVINCNCKKHPCGYRVTCRIKYGARIRIS